MAAPNMSEFIRRVTRGMAAKMLAEHSDQQLLQMALDGYDEAAWQAIMQRHGSMVYRVCWRVLRHSQDAEDAFQATFLVLAKKLRSIRNQASFASWLHSVAQHVALNFKAQSAARQCREQQAARPESLPRNGSTWVKLLSVLDVEVGQLPDKWRLPLILCYLQGRTQDESARQLGWSKNTLRRRLEAARTALGRRLQRRGVAIPAALSAVLFSDCMTSASPTPRLVASTAEATLKVASGHTLTACGVSAEVAALAKGGVMIGPKKMILVWALLFFTGTIAIGAGIWTGTAQVQPTNSTMTTKPSQYETLQGQEKERAKLYKVLIVGENVVVDPKIRIGYDKNGKSGSLDIYSYGGLQFRVSAEEKRLIGASRGIGTMLVIGKRAIQPDYGISDKTPLQSLPDTVAWKKRVGAQWAETINGVRFAMILEVIPGKPFQSKSAGLTMLRMDTLLVKYTFENIGPFPTEVGCQAIIDTCIGEKDGAFFASPTTHPDKVLDGLMLKTKEVPPFIEVLQRPDLQDPGSKGIMTLRVGEKLEGPETVVLTRFDACRAGRELPVALKAAGGNSACVLRWANRDLKPNARRELAFAYGQGIAALTEGLVSADFGGSFEPGKSFTITAYVDKPIVGQTLTLQLPKGIERIGGKATEIVPLVTEAGPSVVAWRCRLAQLGTFPIGIRSSNGLTQTWTITVSPPD